MPTVDDMLDKLTAATGERGLSLTGEGGFLPEMNKAVLERGTEGRAVPSPGLRQGRPGWSRLGELAQRDRPEDGGHEIGHVPLTSRGTVPPRSRRRWFRRAPAT